MRDEGLEVDGAARDEVERQPVYVRSVPATSSRSEVSTTREEHKEEQSPVGFGDAHRKLPLMVNSCVRTVCMSRLMSGRPMPICRRGARLSRVSSGDTDKDREQPKDETLTWTKVPPCLSRNTEVPMHTSALMSPGAGISILDGIRWGPSRCTLSTQRRSRRRSPPAP